MTLGTILAEITVMTAPQSYLAPGSAAQLSTHLTA